MDAKQFEREAPRAMTSEAKLAVLPSMIRETDDLQAAGLRSIRLGLSEDDSPARVRDPAGGGRV